MRIELCLPWRFRRLTPIALAVACLAVGNTAWPLDRAEAGSLVIPAWSFARGNGQIHADPDRYADAGPAVGGGPRRPWGWSLEYDVDIPVKAGYTIQVCYASAEPRPVDVSVDDRDPGKCCTGMTFTASAPGKPPQPTWKSSAAKWGAVYKPKTLQLQKAHLDVGVHTLKIVSRRPLPHLVALRLETEKEFPADWKPPRYEVRDIESVPAEYRQSFPASGEIQVGAEPLQEFPKIPSERKAQARIIPAWTFDRGNIEIYASPDRYADAGPMAGGGPAEGEEGFVEYDIDFPAAGEYTLQFRYAAAEARPTGVWLDGKRVGTACEGLTIGSSRFERPIKFSWSSRSAKWETVRERGRLIKVSVSEGRHTLKLARPGPLPHLLELAFQPGWEAPAREVAHIDQVPPAHRAVFLPPGAVNVAALRLAIRDTMATFGPRYPDGEQYLERLSALEDRQKAAKGGTEEERQKVEEELKALRRRALMAHPALDFDKLLFVKRSATGYGHTYSDQQGGRDMGSRLCILSPVSPDGKITELVPELGDGLFDRFDVSFDAKKVVFAYRTKDKPFRIYEIEIDPVAGKMVPGSLRQLTFGGDAEGEALRRQVGKKHRRFHDIDPVYLPNGKIMFTSTRAERVVFCSPGASVTTLYLMDADGKNLHRISESPVNETALSVMDDGRVIYTRWEYVDKGLGNGESLWAIRPDGSGVDHVYKNNTTWPAAMSSPRTIPGTSKVVAAAGGHHFAAVGPVVVVDMRRSRRTTDAMHCITPEVGYPPSMGYPSSPFGMFMDPYPFSEKFFVVSHRNGGGYYGLYVLDGWGNKARLHDDPELSCFEPVPLRPRPKPVTLATTKTADVREAPPASLFVQDVYEGMTGIERGRVKYIRVMGALEWPWDQHGIPWKLGYKADPHRKKIYGVAKVHEDGSCYFQVPPGENLSFHALDEDYMALQQMPTFINVMPGEQRSCIGCHESRKDAPSMAGGYPTAMDEPPQQLAPQPGDTGPRMVDYRTDVQPIFDQHCVRCHGAENPKARLDLTGASAGKWNRSHVNLIDNRLVSFADCRYGSANFNAVSPLSRGSHLSKLTARLRTAPCKAGITREEFIRIVTWIDANVPFYGTYRRK